MCSHEGTETAQMSFIWLLVTHQLKSLYCSITANTGFSYQTCACVCVLSAVSMINTAAGSKLESRRPCFPT